ncbi:MAG: hypothetical protein HQK53_15340 [Oligoflexia bacterium]|nr:hypothetical protein [Oligoflexia bacterium]
MSDKILKYGSFFSLVLSLVLPLLLSGRVFADIEVAGLTPSLEEFSTEELDGRPKEDGVLSEIFISKEYIGCLDRIFIRKRDGKNFFCNPKRPFQFCVGMKLGKYLFDEVSKLLPIAIRPQNVVWPEYFQTLFINPNGDNQVYVSLTEYLPRPVDITINSDLSVKANFHKKVDTGPITNIDKFTVQTVRLLLGDWDDAHNYLLVPSIPASPFASPPKLAVIDTEMSLDYDYPYSFGPNFSLLLNPTVGKDFSGLMSVVCAVNETVKQPRLEAKVEEIFKECNYPKIIGSSPVAVNTYAAKVKDKMLELVKNKMQQLFSVNSSQANACLPSSLSPLLPSLPSLPLLASQSLTAEIVCKLLLADH